MGLLEASVRLGDVSLIDCVVDVLAVPSKANVLGERLPDAAPPFTISSIMLINPQLGQALARLAAGLGEAGAALVGSSRDSAVKLENFPWLEQVIVERWDTLDAGGRAAVCRLLRKCPGAHLLLMINDLITPTRSVLVGVGQ